MVIVNKYECEDPFVFDVICVFISTCIIFLTLVGYSDSYFTTKTLIVVFTETAYQGNANEYP